MPADRAATIRHRGVTLGYRITEGNAVLSYIPDHEPALGGNIDADQAEWISGLGLARERVAADSRLPVRRRRIPRTHGWGHSGFSDAMALARRSGAEQVALFHHDPFHDDGQLDSLEA